jgi:hypothetical protein
VKALNRVTTECSASPKCANSRVYSYGGFSAFVGLADAVFWRTVLYRLVRSMTAILQLADLRDGGHD